MFLYGDGTNISIHPPRVGRDLLPLGLCQSTGYFNPPSPCGEGLVAVQAPTVEPEISIHPPRVGRDRKSLCEEERKWLFQSTLPVWGGTRCLIWVAPTAGYFNPPSPCGEGPPCPFCGGGAVLFQSTLPVWGGTRAHRGARVRGGISIHPPRVGRDAAELRRCTQNLISIHPPRVGRDVGLVFALRVKLDFNPPSPCGEGPNGFVPVRALPWYFNPPSPCGEGPSIFAPQLGQ